MRNEDSINKGRGKGNGEKGQNLKDVLKVNSVRLVPN